MVKALTLENPQRTIPVNVDPVTPPNDADPFDIPNDVYLNGISPNGVYGK